MSVFVVPRLSATFGGPGMGSCAQSFRATSQIHLLLGRSHG